MTPDDRNGFGALDSRESLCIQIYLPRFVKMPLGSFCSGTREMGSFRQGVTDCRGFVSSRGRGVSRMATACPARVRRTRGTRNRLVSGFCCRALPDCRGFVSRRLSKMGSFRQGVQIALHSFPRSPWECRLRRSASFFSPVRVSAKFGSFGDSRRRYRLPWLRFARAHFANAGSGHGALSLVGLKDHPGFWGCPSNHTIEPAPPRFPPIPPFMGPDPAFTFRPSSASLWGVD